MLSIQYRRLDQCPLFDGNPKQHDIGLISRLIRKHGFRIPSVWDSTANAIVDGNGRVETLTRMMASGEQPPNGIELDDDGMWLIPVVTGIDSDSLEEAMGFLIDANNAVIMGGQFTALDASRAWNAEDYLAILAKSLSHVETVDADDYQLIKHITALNTEQSLFDQPEEDEDEDKKTVFQMKFAFEDEDDYQEVVKFFRENKGFGGREDTLLYLVRNATND
jgi:hypothetical protein